jgi:hypothetical protein
MSKPQDRTVTKRSIASIASKILNEIGQAAINNGCEIITDDSVRRHLSDVGDDLYQEALKILESERLIKIHPPLVGSTGLTVTLKPLGFDLYGKLFINIDSNHKLAEFLPENRFVVKQILELMSDNELVKLVRHAGGHAWISEVSSTIRQKYA